MPNIPSTYTDLAGFQAGQYDIQMVRMALAIADVLTAYGFSTGGGGGGGDGSTQYPNGDGAVTPIGNQINWNDSGVQRAVGLIEPLPVQPGTGIDFPVTGVFWQDTQPVSLTTLPAFTTIPTFKIDQTTPGTTNKVDIGSNGTVAVTGSVAVTGTFYQVTQPVSLTTLPSLVAGTSIIGKVGIDQTTPGTTNLVYAVGNQAAGANDNGNPLKIGGVYNATRPTYTDGKRGDAQLTARGGLLTDFEDYVGTSGNITVIDSGSSTTSGANGQSIITGTATNNSTVSLAGSGNSSFSILITGTWTGTLQFERSLDSGTTWTPIGAFSAGTSYSTSTVTANGAFHGNASSSTNIRVRATATITGTATVKILLGQGTGTVTVGNPIRLFDSVSGAQGSIKAASTAATSTDTALVVAIRDTIFSVGYTTLVSAEFARPADTTAYAAKDVISTSTSSPVVVTFTNFARIADGTGYITKAVAFTDQITNVARLRLHLFHVSPTAINDNSPYLLLYANRANRIGQIDLPAFATEDGTNSTAAASLNDTIRLAYKCSGGSRNIYAVVETLDAFTPVSGQNFYIELTGEHN